MRHAINENDLKPCPHMRTLVSAWIDNRLTGIAKWYTEWHVKHCPQCQSSLPFLRSLHERMRQLAGRGDETIPELRWAKIESAWEKLDEEETASQGDKR